MSSGFPIIGCEDWDERSAPASNPPSGFARMWADSSASEFRAIDSSGNPFFFQGQLGGVNLQTGSSYTVVASDNGKLIVFTGAAPVAITVPVASGFPVRFSFAVRVLGVGGATLTPTTSTIDGASSLAVAQGQGDWIFSDGTNYYTEPGLTSSSGSVYYGFATATASNGNYQVTLGSIPITNSVRIWVNGLIVPPTAYTISGAGVTLYGGFAAADVVVAAWVTTNSTPGGITLGGTRATIRGTSIQVLSSGSYDVPFDYLLAPGGGFVDAAVGDFVLLCASNGYTPSIPSGWTSISDNTGHTWNGFLASKILTAQDIAAGSVTVSISGVYDGVVALVCFIGQPGAIRETDTNGWNVPAGGNDSITTSGSVIAGDIAVYLGTGRAGGGVATVNRGTSLNSGTSADAAGVIAWETMTGGAITAIFNYSLGAGSGVIDYVVIVEV